MTTLTYIITITIVAVLSLTLGAVVSWYFTSVYKQNQFEEYLHNMMNEMKRQQTMTNKTRTRVVGFDTVQPEVRTVTVATDKVTPIKGFSK